MFYQWKDGDCICKLAKENNTTCEKILKINNIKSQDEIKPGDIIRIK